MNDAFLKFLWQYRKFDQRDLCSQTGDKIEILSAGVPNEDEGPDFLNATVRIGKDLWKGSVVVHMDGEDWYRNHSGNDARYSNVILNVCFRNIYPISNAAGHRIPTLELNGKVPAELLKCFDDLMSSNSMLACGSQLEQLDKLALNTLRDKLISESLELQSVEIFRMLDEMNWDWDKVFMKLLIRNFGLGTNSINFIRLSEVVNYSLLSVHRDSVFNIEAILFGQCGMLESEFRDSYPGILRREFNDFRMAYGLEIMDTAEWNYAGTLSQDPLPFKIARLSSLLCDRSKAFHKFIEYPKPWKLLRNLKHSFYWDTHFDLDVEKNGNANTAIGSIDDFVLGLMVNVFAPAIYAYGKSMAVPEICVKAVEILNGMPPEINRKTELFTSFGLECQSASDSFAVNHLVSCYCSDKKCLECPVGCRIINGEPDELPSPMSFALSHHYN